jgi:hypothetical protein
VKNWYHTRTVDGKVKALALDSTCSKKRHAMDVFIMLGMMLGMMMGIVYITIY